MTLEPCRTASGEETGMVDFVCNEREKVLPAGTASWVFVRPGTDDPVPRDEIELGNYIEHGGLCPYDIRFVRADGSTIEIWREKRS